MSSRAKTTEVQGITAKAPITSTHETPELVLVSHETSTSTWNEKALPEVETILL
jgi:hypothetical protein